MDTIKQCEVQTFCDAVELWGVVCGKFPRCFCPCQMLIIELIAQVLSPSVGSQDFDGMAVMLCNSPCLKHFVCLKCVIFVLQEEGGRVPGHIVCEGDKVPSTLAH